MAKRGRKSNKEKLLMFPDNISKEKKELMKKIYKKNPRLFALNINLNKFTLEQLQKHWRLKYETKTKR